MQRISIEGTAALLRGAEDVLIITHIRPDGDTAGSACALCLGLRALGKSAYLAENHPSMRRYEKYMEPYFAPKDFMPGFVAAVDIAGEGQFPPGCGQWAEKCDLAIDHHGTNTGYAERLLLDDHSAAAGELVYLVLRELGAVITPDMAEALYVSLATDTNGFRTAGTTGRTLAIAGAIHDAGFDVFELTRRLFETKAPGRLRLESYLFRSMRFPLPGVCVMMLPYPVIVELGVTEDDMDKLSTLTVVPEDTAAGILLRQLSDGSWKISLRTDGRVHAGQVMRAVGGGGHPDAAGTVLSGEPAALEAAVLGALRAAMSEEKN